MNAPMHLAGRSSYDDWSIWWPATTWGAGFEVGMRYALQVAEDHAYHRYPVIK